MDNVRLFEEHDQVPARVRRSVVLERDYLTALLETARKAVAAGQSKDELVKSVTTIPGFPEHVGLSATFTLATPLGVAYDEASAK